MASIQKLHLTFVQLFDTNIITCQNSWDCFSGQKCLKKLIGKKKGSSHQETYLLQELDDKRPQKYIFIKFELAIK